MQSFFSSVGSGGSSLIGNLMGRLKTTLSNGQDTKQAKKAQEPKAAAEIQSPVAVAEASVNINQDMHPDGGKPRKPDPFGESNIGDLTACLPVCAVPVVIGIEEIIIGVGITAVAVTAASVDPVAIDSLIGDDEKENIRGPSDSDYDPTKGAFDTEHIGKNPPKGEANSHSDANNKNGNKKQRRFYGPDGLPVKDIDLDHYHDGIKPPHVHDWFPNPNGNFPSRDEVNVRKPTLEELDGI